MKDRKFIDIAFLHATAGNGGNGAVSFRREKFVPKGGPDGGDGGRGGHIILRGNPDMDSLIGIYFVPQRRAEHGGPGRGQQMHGRNGADMIVDVPLGTQVMDRESGILIADITTPDEPVTIARGGKGGKGNVHWKSSVNQAPRQHTDGEPGQIAELRLELKLMADVGLVGLPNAGKSSLLTVLSDAHPKIGAYPFTTLNPILGTLIFPDYTRLRIADIPGLIKGAHDGVGLGHAFLRHIERSRCLIYVLDTAGIDGRTPWDDYTCLVEELGLHDPDLPTRPSLVVANKMDCPESAEHLATFRERTGVDPIPVSAQTGEGIDALRAALDTLTADMRRA